MNIFRTNSLLNLVILLILYGSLFLFISSLNSTGFTIDEYNYMQNGKDIVRTFQWNTQLIRNHPPLTFYLHGLASLIFPSQNPWKELFYARLFMLPVFILFALVLFNSAKKYFGCRAAFLSVILFCFNPEILAHARLITPDLTLALFIFLFILSFYEFLKNFTWQTSLKSAFFLGLAFLSKYPALLLVPISLIAFLIYELFFSAKRQFFKNLSLLLMIYFLSIFVTNLGYGFYQSFDKPEEYYSKTFKQLNYLPVIRETVRVFPKPFIQGVDWQVNEAQKPWVWGNFFMGRWSRFGFKSFYILTFFLKTPTPLLILLAIGIYISFKRSTFLDFLIFFTIASFFSYFSFFNNINIGFRYVLLVYPLIFFWVSRVASHHFGQKSSNFFYNLILIFLVLWYIFGTIKIHPYYLAYANELIGGPKNAWKYWADSTLDWGQDNDRAGQYLRLHPEIQIDPQKPVVGKLALSVNSLNLFNYNNYIWLRQLKKEPIDTIGYTWLVFDITKEDAQKISDYR